ncbi:MAG: diguanylate cyclase [Phycisphaerae bacterium]|nr:diguanylate cyclase [Phycisphaerae bacterium]
MMTDEKERKVLAIDDNQTNLALLRVYMKQMGVKSLSATSAVEGIDIAIEENPDLIFLDIMMPEVDGFECCQRLKSDTRTAHIPIIFVSAKGQAADKVDGLKRGAMDYISKPFDPAELRARVSIVLQMIAMQEKLVDQANTDGLTGLSNRRHFFEVFERQLLEYKLTQKNVSVIMLDLDHFKNVNDTYGHQGGDIALKQLASIIKDNIYPLDLAARYGGEEFVIMMPDTNLDKAYQAAEKIRTIICDSQWDIAGNVADITASLGVASTSQDGTYNVHELLKQADGGLYAAKARGRNCVVRFDEIDSVEHLEVEVVGDIEEMQKQVSGLAERMHEQAMSMVAAFSQALYAKDPLTEHHAENVCLYTKALAKQLSLDEELTASLETAALLHDLGKISIPENILQKNGELDDKETEMVRKHPVLAVDILSPVKIFEKELPIIKYHHENYDGSGYPDGLMGKKIPFGARILRITNFYEVITSDSWRSPAKSSEAALEMIRSGSGKEFDPELVDAFCAVVGQYAGQWPVAIETEAAV